MRCTIDVRFGRREDNGMMGFQVELEVMSHKELVPFLFSTHVQLQFNTLWSIHESCVFISSSEYLY